MPGNGESPDDQMCLQRAGVIFDSAAGRLGACAWGLVGGIGGFSKEHVWTLHGDLDSTPRCRSSPGPFGKKGTPMTPGALVQSMVLEGC